MVLIGDTHWLRIPVGKLHNDRYVPLLPYIVELINDHRPDAARRDPGVSSNATTADRSTGAPSTATSPPSRNAPASDPCTPTSSATPSPLKPSTAA